MSTVTQSDAFSPKPADAAAWLRACPSAAALFEMAEDEGAGFRLVEANAAALELLHLDAPEAGAGGLGAAVIACLHDPREPAFRDRVLACARDGAAPLLKLSARPPGAAAAVLLEAGFVRAGSHVLVFLQEARARGREAPERIDATTMQRAVFEISRATHEAPTLDALFARIHALLERLIGAKNFYIALVDEPEQMLRFVYSKDEFDRARPDRRLGLGVTESVYLTGQPLLMDRTLADRMLQEGAVVNYGTPAQVWLGVPLIVAGRPVGVMAVQDYYNPHFVGEPEREFLTYISSQIANAIAVKRAEEEARAARAEAERAARVKSDFLAVMSHELRTPLTVIIGFSDLLHESLGASPAGAQAARIGEAGQRLLAAVNQMLDFSRIDALSHAVAENVVALPELLQICAGHFSARLAEKSISLALRHEGFVPECLRTDPDILKQIVLQLLSNAVKFTPEGGRVGIVVRAQPAAPFHANRHQFEIAIEDTGPGVPGKMLPRLFQPFERGHRPGALEGAGLGLAIGQRLAGLLAGRIAFHGGAGGGSVFTLRFHAPAATRSGQDPQLPDAMERLELLLRSRLGADPWQVLIMDANADSRAITAGLVESLSGRAPLVASSRAEAEGRWREARPQLVLIDTHANDADGLELCGAWQGALAAHGRPFVVAMSVDHAPAFVERCRAAGADTYVPKPFSRRSVLEALLAAADFRTRLAR